MMLPRYFNPEQPYHNNETKTPWRHEWFKDSFNKSYFTTEHIGRTETRETRNYFYVPTNTDFIICLLIIEFLERKS